VNAKTFELATRTIRGHDAIEEYLTCSLWPLRATWDLGEVEKEEAPLSKVTIPLPRVLAMKGSQELDSDFVTRIAAAANRLIGNYSAMEHRICLGQPCLGGGWRQVSTPTGASERLPRKQKTAQASEAETALGKAKSVKSRRTSDLKKFSAKEMQTCSSGLSVAKKVSAATTSASKGGIECP
jgi:hypothetical protein